MLDRRLRVLALEALDLTEPPPGVDAEEEPGVTVSRVVLGWLLDSRRTLKGLLVLAGSGIDDVGDGLARATFEHAATAGWLLAEAREERLELVVTAYASDWIQVQEEWARKRPSEPFPYPDDLAFAGITQPRGASCCHRSSPGRR